MICQWVFQYPSPFQQKCHFCLLLLTKKKTPTSHHFLTKPPPPKPFHAIKHVFFFTPRLSGKKAWPQRTCLANKRYPWRNELQFDYRKVLYYISYMLISFCSIIDILYRYIILFSNYLDLFSRNETHIDISTEFFFEGRTKDHGSDPFNVWWCWKIGRLFSNPVKDVKDLPTIMDFK